MLLNWKSGFVKQNINDIFLADGRNLDEALVSSKLCSLCTSL